MLGLFLLALTFCGTVQSLEMCDDIQLFGNPSKTQICKNGQEFGVVIVNSSIGILDVSEVDEDKQSVHIQFQMILNWFDNHISLIGPLANETGFFEIPVAVYDSLYVPKLMFIKSKSTEIVPLYGDNKHSVSYFWMEWDYYKWQWKMEYSQSVKIELGCYFDFYDYPFDRGHNCLLEYFAPSYDANVLSLGIPSLFDPISRK